MTQQLLDRIRQIAGEDHVRPEEPMSRHTTFRIGGPAECFVSVKDEETLRWILGLCREEDVPCSVIGNGSNLLVGDMGVRGVIAQIGREMSGIRIEGERVYAQAGAMLSGIARYALTQASLGGMEFAAGIPGTLGGAVVMNAGAYGGEMKDIITSVRVLDDRLQIRDIPAEEMAFGYRTSIVKEKGYIVLGAGISLQQGDPAKITARIEELREMRVSKQPLDMPSAGSTFKRPDGYFAGKLIMDAGLRGYSVGGAQVSPKHCGFIVNTGDATAADVAQLMGEVQEKVRSAFGVTLEPEVKKLGDFV